MKYTMFKKDKGEKMISNQKDINKHWLSFEIKISHISDNCYVPMDKYKCKEIKSDKKMIINHIEYNYIKKKLNEEYGIKDEFKELDKEIKRILKKGIK